MRTAIAAASLTVLALAGLPAVAYAQAPTASSSNKPQPPPKIPKKKLAKQLPKFATQPKVVKREGAYQIQAKVRLRPWATPTKHRRAKPDTVRVTLDVAKKNTQIRYVGLSAKPGKQGLLWSGKIGPSVVDKAEIYTISLPVTTKVGRSLSAQTPKQQRARVRMTIEHRKDVSPVAPRRDAIQLAQSGPFQVADRIPSKAKKASARLSGNGESITATGEILNFTPFELETSVQGVNCVSDESWTGTVYPFGYVSYAFQVYTSGSAMANDYADANTLSSDAINALESSAKTAGTSAAAAGSALFTPAGAVSAAVGWATAFVGDFIKDIEDNSCSSQPSLFTTSATSLGDGWTIPVPSYESGYYGIPTDPLDGPSLVSFPANYDIASMNGAQTSTQWHWNDGEPQPSGPGSFNWSGGLLSVASGSPTAFGVDYYFESDASNPTGFGPAPTVWPVDPANPNSAGLSAQWDDGSMTLNCDPGQWDLYNPWGDSLALSPGALSPANTNASSGNQMYMAVSYNGTDATGAAVTNESFTGVEPVTSFSSATQSFTLDAAALQGITVDEWQCSIGASIQVGDWAVPSTWPTNYLGDTPNGAWWNAPNLIVTAPYVAP